MKKPVEEEISKTIANIYSLQVIKYELGVILSVEDIDIPNKYMGKV